MVSTVDVGVLARANYNATWILVTAVATCPTVLALWMIYNVFLHSLRRYPGPKLWAATRLPWCWHQYHGRLPGRIADLHVKYGPIVRVAPNEISYTTDTAWKTIYGQRPVEMSKDPIFSIRNPSGVPNILNADREGHSRQRRLLSHAFSEKALREQESILLYHINKLLQNLSTACTAGPVNLTEWFNFTTYDIIGDLSFGEGFGCLDRGDYDDFVRSVRRGTKELMFQQILAYYKLSPLYKFLVPKSIAGSRLRNLQRTAATVERRIKRDTNRKDFLQYILAADEIKGMSKAEIHSNAFSLVIAGSESTASALTGTIFLLRTHPDVYQRLVREIRSTYESEDEIRLANVHELEYLEAVTMESLRMYPPVPIALPRQVPDGGETIDGVYVSAGTTVGVHHLAAYRSPNNFYRPNDFLPERWLASHRDSKPFSSDNRASLQPFSFGPRNCLGKNLARSELRLILTKLLWRFDIELVEGQEDWMDGQLAFGLWWKPPMMCRLMPVTRD
ncbi:hypothetical protein VTO42DRAFT_2172 [Malbranchea cinnamomea]